MQEAYSFPKPLGVGELIDRAFRLYRNRFGILLLTAAVLLIPYAIVSGVTMGSAMVGYFDMLQNIGTQAPDSPEEIFSDFGIPFASFFGSIFLISIFGLVVNGLVILSLTRQEIAGMTDEKMTVMQGLRAGLNRLLPYIGMMFLIGLAFTGLLFVFGIIVAMFALLTGGFGASGGGSDAAIFGAIMGMLCLYFVVILAVAYFAVRWSVVVPAMVEQNLGPIESLGASWRLTKGHFWRTFLFGFVISLLGIIIVSVPSTIISQLGLLFTGQLENMFVMQTVSTAVSTLFSVVWIPLYTAAYLMYYYDLRVRNEGFDLAQRISRLESDLEEKKPF